MLRKDWKVMIVLLAGSTLVGCAQTPADNKTTSPPPDLVACEDPRPQMCTAIYDPVCGLTADNEFKTYASGCTACGDAKLSGYIPGACE